jgi:hypothetical protein
MGQEKLKIFQNQKEKAIRNERGWPECCAELKDQKDQKVQAHKVQDYCGRKPDADP